MKKCKNLKKRKHLAYGQKYNKENWCRICDCHFSADINKGRARQQAKMAIKKELEKY